MPLLSRRRPPRKNQQASHRCSAAHPPLGLSCQMGDPYAFVSTPKGTRACANEEVSCRSV